MSEREPRKRIPYTKGLLPALTDDLAFVKNKCSDNARKETIVIKKITTHIWFDKHYHDRHLHGDEMGKREGIDPGIVKNLVERSVEHLIFYSCVIRGFKFINHEVINEPPVRIVLQQELNSDMLNVIIEPHYLDLNELEITVKTAMCTCDFRIAMGQYVIELQEDRSILKKRDNNTITEVCSF